MADEMAELSIAGLSDDEIAELSNDELDKIANAGDKDALKALLDRFKDDPKGLIHLGWGNLARLVEVNVLRDVIGHAPVTDRAVRAKMREIRRELGGPDPTPLERLLVERIALNWMHLHLAELLRTTYSPGGTIGKSVKLFEARDRQCQRAHDRYVKSLKALAVVRKLNLPDIQINAIVTTGPGAIPGRPADRAIEGRAETP